MSVSVEAEIRSFDDDGYVKTCKTCKQEKPASEYYTHNTNSDGLFSSCKKCVLDKRRQKYAARKELDGSHLDRVQQFIQGYRDPSELADDEVIGSFIRDDNGVPNRSFQLREKYLPKFSKELKRRLDDYVRQKTPRALEVIFEIADNDLYEAADRLKAATWITERLIGKTPDVVLTGTTEAPYTSILEGITAGSREDYRRSISSTRPGFEGIEEALDAEVIEDSDDLEGEENTGLSKDSSGDVLRSEIGEGRQLRADSNGSDDAGSVESDEESGETMLERDARLERERQARLERAAKIRKAKQRRFAARAVGAKSLATQPWLVELKPIRGSVEYKLNLIPPEKQTIGIIEKVLKERSWEEPTEDEIMARRNEALAEEIAMIEAELRRVKGK